MYRGERIFPSPKSGAPATTLPTGEFLSDQPICPQPRDPSLCLQTLLESPNSSTITAATLISEDMSTLFRANLAEVWQSLSGESPVVYSYMGEVPCGEFSESLLYRSPTEKKQPTRVNFFTMDDSGKLVVYSSPAELGNAYYKLDTSTVGIQQHDASPEEILDNAQCLLRKMAWLVERRVAKEGLRTDDARAQRLTRGLNPISGDIVTKIRFALANASGNVDLITTALCAVQQGIPTATPY